MRVLSIPNASNFLSPPDLLKEEFNYLPFLHAWKNHVDNNGTRTNDRANHITPRTTAFALLYSQPQPNQVYITDIETMKTVAILSLLAGSAVAFAPSQQTSRSSTSLAAYEESLGSQPPLGFWYVLLPFFTRRL